MPISNPSSGSLTATNVEINFGTTAVTTKAFTITDAAVSATSKVFVMQDGSAATGKSADENEMDLLNFSILPAAGSFTLNAKADEGPVKGAFKINYLIAT